MLLLIIDPQNDFVSPAGSLSVPGAVADLERLAAWIAREGDRIEQIVVTLDQHHVLEISHPGWWRGPDGAPPAPFTPVSAEDVEQGRITTADPAARERSVGYLRALASTGRYPHVIWPEHCLIGDVGGNVWPPLSAALHAWERARGRNVRWVPKGQNPWTEHFSALRAEVPDPEDPGTQVSASLLTSLREARSIHVAGEARSHCVANTVRDLVTEAPEVASRLVLLSDAMSDVPGFADRGEAFVSWARGQGIAIATTGWS